MVSCVKMDVPLLENMEIQKKSYFFQMIFFCKTLVYGRNWEFFSVLQTQEYQTVWETRH